LYSFYETGDHPNLHPFPTRRSSDLSAICCRTFVESASALEPGAWKMGIATALRLSSSERSEKSPAPSSTRATSRRRVISPCSPRSEEHTSELQSRSDLVCRLLLEKK